MCTKYIFVFFISDSRGVSVVFVSLEDSLFLFRLEVNCTVG